MVVAIKPIDRQANPDLPPFNEIEHIDKLKSSGALQIEDRSEAARKIRELMFGKYTKEQIEAAALPARNDVAGEESSSTIEA